MPRRVWRSLDGPYVAPAPGDTVDLRGTTKDLVAQERKEILLANYYAGIGSYFGGYSSITTTPGRPWTVERGVREGYARVPWVHAAVRVIAISQSRLRFGVKDSDKPVGRGATEVADDPLIPLLNVRSNPVEYAYQLRQRVSTQWMLSPRGGFLEAVPPKNAGRSKRTVELRLLPPGRTRIVPDRDGNIDHFEVDPVGGLGKPRPIAPDKVRWFREPHPTDPFAGLTPLEAAGLSIEMDYFARLFNRQFMANDGRPGGIVAVSEPGGKGEPADDAELDRIERKFGGGPIDAGRLVVVDGTVTYQDVTKSARDMQWKDAGIQARNEIFGVFLVPVSAIDASGRTFSNAGQEWINFWTLMGQPHGDGFAWLFHDDVDGVPFLDYSKVKALQEIEADQRAEWRDEVESGTRSRLSYAQQTGQEIGDGPGQFPDVPGTRALWLPAGLVPVSATPDDQVEVEKLAPIGQATQAAPMRGGAAGDGGGIDGGAPDGGGDDGGYGGGGGYDGGYPDGGAPADGGYKAARPTHVQRLRQRRARQLRVVGGATHDDADKEDDRARPVEAALATALTAMAQRQVAVALARARGTKARMGTRHWAPKPGAPWSTKQLDANDVVDPSQWGDQATAVAQQNLAPLAQQQYDETRQQAEDDGGADVVAVLGPVVAGAAALALAGEVAQLVTWLATSAANAGADLLEAVATAERLDAERVAAGGQTLGIQPVVDAIQKWAQGIPGWVQQVVPTSVAQAVEAGKHAVLAPLGDRVAREWRTRLDDRVRDAHKAAEGQVAAGGQPFVVGGEQLRYPRDPLGSPGNVINCRCRTRWRLAAKAEGKSLDVGQNVIADVLRLPAPKRPAPAAGADAACAEPGVAVGGPRWAGRGIDRVDPVAALAGVTGRDHVAEMLGAELKDIVRTAAGEHAFHEPIGSPIGHGGGDWQAHRILKVHDSRDLVEQGDKFVRVPGTGEMRQCDRCGKGHEVHVTVEDQHGAQHTVGTACARATGPAASKLKSVASATATADRLEAQAAKAETYQQQRRDALEQLKATKAPPAHAEQPSKLGSGTDFVLPTGERQRVTSSPPTDKDRAYAVARLAEQWYGRQLDQLVPKQPGLDYADVAEMKRKAAKARKKADDLLDAPSAEGKARHVATASGVEQFHMPIGSPIGGHLDAPHVKPHEPSAAELGNLFGGEFAGFRTSVTGSYRKDDGSIAVSGTIHAGSALHADGVEDDEPVGEFRRSFHADTGHVEHAWLTLDDQAQGLGFATAFNAHAEKQYAQWGYRQIDVEAGDQAGGIVWAKAGYLFDEGRPPEDVTDALDYAQMSGSHGAWNPDTGGTDHLKMSAAESKAVQALVARARGDNEVTPAEVVAAGPIAQAIMREYGWNGYKPIDGIKAAGDVMRVRVRGTQPLAGVHRRDHVAEMLAPTESKVRRVRTAGGARRFHEPIGAPIVAHPGLHGIGGRDHAGDVAADAARTATAQRELADRMAAVHARAYGLPSGGPSPHFPGGGDHPHAKGDRVAVSTLAGDHAYHGTVHGVGPDGTVHVIPDGKTGASNVQLVHPSAVAALPAGDGGATGDMAKAKAELAGKGKDVAGLMAGGMSAEAAAKEYARLLHNARFRYRRERLKAEKQAGGKVADKVAEDLATPKKVTLAGVGQQLLDDPEAVQLDKALTAEAGTQPKALYSVPYGSGADTGATPGGVEPGQEWYDKLTADTTEPIPVAGLNFGGGYVVKHGLAMRRGGVSYLIETPTAEPSATHLAALEQTAKVYDAFLATVPGDRRLLQRGVALLAGKNPADDHWAKKFNQPGFTSAATGGRGGTTYWNGNVAHPGLAAHEYGHNLDSGVHLPGGWVSDSGPVLEGQAQGWDAATYDDRSTAGAWKPGGELAGRFVETRADPHHPITPGADSPTVYAAHNRHEDFAESTRLYLKDRREGKLGYLKPEGGSALGTNVRFADLWPARAKVLDAAFGVQSDYETPFVKEQQAKAAAAVEARRLEIHEALQTQGAVPAELGLDDIMRKWGLSIRAGADAWQQADDKFKATLAAKNEKDALEHVKELLSGQANTPEPGQVGELEATLADGFGLSEGKAQSIVAAGVSWHGQQLEAAAQAAKATEAKLAAEQAVQDVLSLEDLPKEVQTVIRKRRANVKLRAKQKGASAEQAEAVAAAYEAEQIAKEAKKLGLSGQVLGKEIVKGKVAEEVHGQAAGPALRVKPAGTGGSKGSATWLAKAGDAPAPLAKNHLGGYSSYGKPQQAKANIAATLGGRLNNAQDWEVFRAYRNGGAHSGYNMQFELPTAGNEVKAFGDYTPEQRQALLDGEVSQRVSMWASTSGDSNPFAVMMQQAVKDELGVPGPVGVNASNGSTQQEVDKRYPHVAAFYRRLVREQYEHTQEQLAADGVEWVVLYRGMGIERGSHEWANDTDSGHVPLQPVSSFSTAPTVAQRFAGHGSKRMMIRGAVHRSMILGSARTGFGCLNEKEFVVLAPRDEDEGRFQVRYFTGSKVADIKNAFAKPPKATPTMSAADAAAAIKKSMHGQPLSPGMLLQRLAQTPAGQPVNYPIGDTSGVNLPRDAVLAYLDNYGYDVSQYMANA